MNIRRDGLSGVHRAELRSPNHIKRRAPETRPELMVRMRGLEPPRCHHHRLLRPARLPVPPHPRGNSLYEWLMDSVKPYRCMHVVRSLGSASDFAKPDYGIAIDQLNTLVHSSNGDDSNSHSCHIDCDGRFVHRAGQTRWYHSDCG